MDLKSGLPDPILKDWFYLIQGQRLDNAAETYPNRDAYVFTQTNQRLTFENLKKKVNSTEIDKYLNNIIFKYF